MAQKEIHFGNITRQEKQYIADEVNILRNLKHPNIVQYCGEELNRSAQVINLYMEYCGHGDLANLIQRYKEEKKRFTEQEVLKFFTQLLLALYRCHYGENAPACDSQWPREIFHPKQSVLHRDIKPANIFLDENNSVKLGDFGLSKLLDNTRVFTQSYVGTPYYMSPEIIRSSPYSAKSDVWALGCVIFEICMLTHPFEGRSYLELQRNICQGNLSCWDHHYSDDVFLLIRHCLEVNSDLRPTTYQLLRSPILSDIRSKLESERVVLEQSDLLHKKHQMLIQLENDLQFREQRLSARESELENVIASRLAQREEILRRELEKQLRDMDARYQRHMQTVVNSMQKMRVTSPVDHNEQPESSTAEMFVDCTIEASQSPLLHIPKLGISKPLQTLSCPGFTLTTQQPILKRPTLRKELSSRALHTTATLMKYRANASSLRTTPIDKDGQITSLQQKNGTSNQVADCMNKLLHTSLDGKKLSPSELCNKFSDGEGLPNRKVSKLSVESDETAVSASSGESVPTDSTLTDTKSKSVFVHPPSPQSLYVEKLEKLNIRSDEVSKPSKASKTLHGYALPSLASPYDVHAEEKIARENEMDGNFKTMKINQHPDEYVLRTPKKIQLLEGQKRSPVKQLGRLGYNKLRRSAMDNAGLELRKAASTSNYTSLQSRTLPGSWRDDEEEIPRPFLRKMLDARMMRA